MPPSPPLPWVTSLRSKRTPYFMRHHWTHFVAGFSKPRGGDEQAICRRCIDPSLHSATPTCPRCRELLAEHELGSPVAAPRPVDVERWA